MKFSLNKLAFLIGITFFNSIYFTPDIRAQTNNCSVEGNTTTSVKFTNNTNSPVNVFWVDYNCQEVKYNTLQPQASYTQQTYVTHPWRIRNAQTGALLKEFTPTATTTANIVVGNNSQTTQTPTTTPSNQTSSSSMSQEILSAHNKYRAEVGVPPLTWSDSLARDAKQWANYLVSSNGSRLKHSTQQQRGGKSQGENLWGGTAGVFNYTQMIDRFGSEKQYFIPNRTFPNLSNTGNWMDVGHYTQIIWRNTTEVGCAMSTGNGKDILVCRYNPPGNYTGQKVY